jgi:hypothetical protein
MENHISPIKRFREELTEMFSTNKMVIFLCGPSAKDLTKKGARLRKEIEERLKLENFEVFLGEDDGLENIREEFNTYAHENELLFIRRHCHAVILVASSVGAYCELGLFSYDKVHTKDDKTDFILIMSEDYKGTKSYLNEGPAKAVEDYGKVFYGDLDDFDFSQVIERLKRRRSVLITSK